MCLNSGLASDCYLLIEHREYLSALSFHLRFYGRQSYSWPPRYEMFFLLLLRGAVESETTTKIDTPDMNTDEEEAAALVVVFPPSSIYI